MNHQKLLDSADFYKRTDLEKSIDFIAQSITLLGKRGNKKELASSFTTLGEIYLYHKQYDLAITNFEDALAAQKSVATTLLLGKAYILNNDFQKAESTLSPLGIR